MKKVISILLFLILSSKSMDLIQLLRNTSQELKKEEAIEKAESATSALIKLVYGGPFNIGSIPPPPFASVSKDVIEGMLKARANPNVKTISGNTALHEAVRANKLEIVKLLVESGANVNSKNAWGYTPLFCAVHDNNDLAIAQILIEAGADLTFTVNDGSLLHLAVRYGKYKFVKLFLDKKLDPNIIAPNGETPLTLAFEHPTDDANIIKMLLDYGAIPEIRNKSGELPLDKARKYRYWWRGREDAVKLLVAMKKERLL